MAELRLPKPITRVRFPSPAPFCAYVAQQAERSHGKAEVTGSIPVVGSTYRAPLNAD